VSAGAQALGGAARSGVGGAFNKAFSGMGMRSNVGSQVGSQIGQKIGGAANTFGQGMVSTAGSAISKGISSVGSMFSGNKNPTGSFGMGGDSSTPGGGVLRPGVNTSVASTPTATNAATGQPVNTAYRQ
jgi:hypothetical protein